MSIVLLVLGACGGTQPDDGAAGAKMTPVPFTGADWNRSPRDAASLFVSGHSLVDQPLPTFVAGIAQSLGTPAEWERQYVVGSSIMHRSRGLPPNPEWSGYRLGYNREGEGLDVLQELREPRSVPSGKYDVLLITEQHSSLGGLLWNDTVRHLRHYHERFIESNPSGTTYFYESWLGLEKDDPQRWIAYEKAASPVWQCMATRVNASLELEGRTDRIVSLPAGIALAALTEKATTEGGVPGVTQATTRETVDSLIADDVHLTPLGAYYMSLVSYSAIYRRPPTGAWIPDGVSETQAHSLQAFAWEFIDQYYRNYAPLAVAACQGFILDEFNRQYWDYIRDTQWRKQDSYLRAQVRWWRHVVEWHYKLSRQDTRNPLYFNPATDRDFWFAPP